MEFEWDEAKRLANIAKHGLDFLDAPQAFEDRHLLAPARMSGTESRWLLLGRIEGRVVAIIFARRGATIRLISMRRARDDERRQYTATFG
jgi:hypothetical protein